MAKLKIMSIIALIAFVSFSLVSSQAVIEIQTKTGPGEDDGMKPGSSLDIEIFNKDFLRCVALDLNSQGTNFNPGRIDSFAVSIHLITTVENCNKTIINMLTMWHICGKS